MQERKVMFQAKKEERERAKKAADELRLKKLEEERIAAEKIKAEAKARLDAFVRACAVLLLCCSTDTLFFVLFHRIITTSLSLRE